MKLLFPGTFDPFTIGHADLVERALAFADSIVIGVGVNSAKSTMFTARQRVDCIRRHYAGNQRVEVVEYNGLTMDFARRSGADAILRGVRSTADYENETVLSDANLKIGGVDTILLVSRPEFQHVSSSLVRELHSFGHPVDEFVIDTFKSLIP